MMKGLLDLNCCARGLDRGSSSFPDARRTHEEAFEYPIAGTTLRSSASEAYAQSNTRNGLSGLELASQSLVTARGQLDVALDALHVCPEAEERLQEVELLKSVVKTLRTIEQRLVPTSRQTTSGKFSNRKTNFMKGSAVYDQEVEEWLKSNYTQGDDHVRNILSEWEKDGGEMTAASSEMAMRGRIPTEAMDKRLSYHETLANSDVKNALARAGFFGFDTLAFAAMPEVLNYPVTVIGMHLVRNCRQGCMMTAMHERNRFADLWTFETSVANFFSKIDDKYAPVPERAMPKALYHSRAHAADIMSLTAWFMSLGFLKERTNALERFMVLVASAIHDVGHMGRNNLFYTKTMHPLAIRYNNNSVLENMHVATAFELMQQETSCNWFTLMKGCQEYLRKGLISLVLATDPNLHKKHTDEFVEVLAQFSDNPKDLKMRGQKGASDVYKQKCLDAKFVLLGTILHASDVSTPTKPIPAMLSWSKLLFKEFWMQGDEERQLGVPISMLCDREAGIASIPKGQLGFINFVIQPFFNIIVGAIEETEEATNQLELNIQFWQEKAAENATFEDLFGEAP